MGSYSNIIYVSIRRKKTHRNSFYDRSTGILYKQLPSEARRGKKGFLPRVSEPACLQFGFGFLASRIPLWVPSLQQFLENNIEGYFLNLIMEIYKKPTANIIFHSEMRSPQDGNKAKDICSNHCCSNTVIEILAKAETRKWNKKNMNQNVSHVFLFTEDMIVYIEKLEDSTKNPRTNQWD